MHGTMPILAIFKKTQLGSMEKLVGGGSPKKLKNSGVEYVAKKKE
jgi:hypothetical protein